MNLAGFLLGAVLGGARAVEGPALEGVARGTFRGRGTFYQFKQRAGKLSFPDDRFLSYASTLITVLINSAWV